MAEGCRQGAGDGFLVVNQESLEHGLVHQAAMSVISGEVGRVKVPHKVQRSLQVRLNCGGFQFRDGKTLFDALKLNADTTLLRRKKVKRDRLGVVRFKQLRSLVQ